MIITEDNLIVDVHVILTLYVHFQAYIKHVFPEVLTITNDPSHRIIRKGHSAKTLILRQA